MHLITHHDALRLVVPGPVDDDDGDDDDGNDDGDDDDEEDDGEERPAKKAAVGGDGDDAAAAAPVKRITNKGITIGNVGPALSIAEQMPKPEVPRGLSVLEHIPTHFLFKKLLEVCVRGTCLWLLCW